jgi:23S rRNA pseudouridine1911/1915/1917 synthase
MHEQATADVLELVAAVDGQRLDAFLATMLSDVDRIEAGALVRGGRVEIVGRPKIKPSTWLAVGDRLRVALPPPKRAEVEPQDLALPMLYRDDDLVIVAKPAGMATHPGPGWWTGSAVNALLFHEPSWRPIGGVATPGIVHRLDRDTGGLLVFANGTAAHQALLLAMRAREVKRSYLAIVHGHLMGTGTVDLPLERDPAMPERVIVSEGGKSAVTHWRSLGTLGARTLLEITLATGRNHQIRVHMAALGCPVVGDPWYGRGDETETLRLYAYRLALRHPRLGTWLAIVSLPPWMPPETVLALNFD